MAAESEELKALSFVRRSLLRKNEKIRELTRKVESLSEEVDSLKWKCADQQNEIETLRESLETYQEPDLTGEEHPTNEGIDTAATDTIYPDAKHKTDQNIESVEGVEIKTETDTNIGEIIGQGDTYDGTEQSTDETMQQDTDMLAEAHDPETMQQSEYIPTDGLHDEQTFNEQSYPHQHSISHPHHSRVSTIQAAGGGGAPQRELLQQALRNTTMVGRPGRNLKDEGQRVYRHQCPICGMKSKSPFNVRRHMRTHTGEKPFNCPQCEMTFTQKSAMKTHVKVQHPQYKMFHCSMEGCQYVCVTINDLQLHVRKRHYMDENAAQ